MKKISNLGVNIYFYPSTNLQIQVRYGTEVGEELLRTIEINYLATGVSYSLAYDTSDPTEDANFTTDLATIDSLLS